MTQLDLLTAPCEPETLVDRMLTFFARRPGEWIDVAALAEVGGIGGWRTRVSDVRHRGVRIEHRLIKWTDGRNRSQYRYVPASERAA